MSRSPSALAASLARLEQRITRGCASTHRMVRIVHVFDDEPVPPAPAADRDTCAVCGEPVEIRTIVHHYVWERGAEPDVDTIEANAPRLEQA